MQRTDGTDGQGKHEMVDIGINHPTARILGSYRHHITCDDGEMGREDGGRKERC